MCGSGYAFGNGASAGPGRCQWTGSAGDPGPANQHWFLALAAPGPFIALEGETDTISLPEAVRQSILGAQPAYALFDAKDRLGVNYARHGHAFTVEDWTAMMDFFDKHLLGKKTDRTFDRFPTD